MNVYKYGRNGDAGVGIAKEAIAPIASYSFGVKGTDVVCCGLTGFVLGESLKIQSPRFSDEIVLDINYSLNMMILCFLFFVVISTWSFTIFCLHCVCHRIYHSSYPQGFLRAFHWTEK